MTKSERISTTVSIVLLAIAVICLVIKGQEASTTNCPYCRSNQTTCTDSREQPNNLKRRRRYKCLVCGGRYSTMEEIIPEVVKTPKQEGEADVKVPSKRSQRFKGETKEERDLRTLSCYQSGKVSCGKSS